MPCPQPDDPTPSTSAVPIPTSGTTCVRCKANPAVAIFRDSIYCEACALTVFETKAKSGLEYARGAGLARYVAAARASPIASASTPSPSAAPSTSTRAEGGRKINNGGGNAEVNVSANIAIGFSGGPSSRALLRTAVRYFRPETRNTSPRVARRKKGKGEPLDDTPDLEQDERKKNGAANATGRFNEVGKIYVIYIDDSAIVEDGVDRTAEARRMVEEEGCPDLQFVGMKLEDIYRASMSSETFASGFTGVPWHIDPSGLDETSQRISSIPCLTEEPTAALRCLFASLHPTSTPRTGASSARTRVEDLHRVLLHTLLRYTASYYSCSALLLGDSGTRISIRLIEDLAKGAGYKIPIANADAVWVDDLLVVRPLKTHLLQEVMFFNSVLGLDELQHEGVIKGTTTTKQILQKEHKEGAQPVMDKSSIARLTETFILNLEKGVPSTVTTIGKTGGKLVLNSAHDSMPMSAAHSTSGFQQVGPSVPLRTRTKGIEAGISNLSVADASEPRIGSRGIKLAQTSAGCPRWSTKAGCALCGMPSQHPHARHWKKGITISSLDATAPAQIQESQEANKGQIELADWLCYACLLVLSPPGRGDGSDEVLLPAYVLEHVQRAMRRESSEDGNAVPGEQPRAPEDAEKREKGVHGQCASKLPSQPLAREQIKAQINEFLLEDA